MKVFWSWQSDHPGKISRHFVREALEEAIRRLKEDPDVEEPVRDAELDHDRKGVPGSPDLANVILEKIRDSEVFVADVTPVGATDDAKKKLINANVAIELGYALGTIGDRALLMVMNKAFGTRDDLPFDLKHKAGPIFYELEGAASRDDIKNAKSKLVSDLKTPLRAILSTGGKATGRPFAEAAHGFDSRGVFFDKGAVLAKRNEVEYRCDADAFVFIRLFPAYEVEPLRRADAEDLLRGSNVGVLDNRSRGYSTDTNEYGAIAFEATSTPGEILSGTQLFQSRELWGFDAYMLSPQRTEKRCIPTGWHETMIDKGLRKYVQFATSSLQLSPPFISEIGLTNVRGYELAMDSKMFPWDRYWGPIHDEDIVVRRRLDGVESKDLEVFLLEVFELIFDAGGVKRPKNYNGFPGDTPGTMPRDR